MRLRFPRPRSVLTGVSVLLPRGPGVAPTQLPAECACCGAPATHHSALPRKDGASLLIGYCDECAEHQASSASRVLSLALSSLLLGLVGAAGLPLVAAQLGLFPMLLVVFALSLLPLCFVLLPTRAAAEPHVSLGPAVHWVAERLWCASPRYAARVAALNAAELHGESHRTRLASPWLSAGPLLGVGAAYLSFLVYHPLLRILNLGTTRIEVAIDGKGLVAVDPTSNESPSAGALLRVPAGQHTVSISATVDGAALGTLSANFQSGAMHLFAFAAEGTCFWLETTGYGQEKLSAPSYDALASSEHFENEPAQMTVWVIPQNVDTWFAASPVATDQSSHSSGGLLTALRQAPCAEAPQEVRPVP